MIRNTISFEQDWKSTALAVDEYLARVTRAWEEAEDPGLVKIRESMAYSLLSGGKRFRPVLCLWTYRMLNADMQMALPVAAAIEMIHCYSLIHDDLPAMDNDDLRRGLPTNHKVFGEGMALLAGNALLTEAFGCVVESYKKTQPAEALSIVTALSRAAGYKGMVGGQAIDISHVNHEWTPERLCLLHRLKTGALIAVSVEVAAVLAGAGEEDARSLQVFGENLGLAFQIADDLLDFDSHSPETMNFATVMGVQHASELLNKVSESAHQNLKHFGPKAQPLLDMIEFNLNRKS